MFPLRPVFIRFVLLALVAGAARADPLPDAFVTALADAGIPLAHVAAVVQPLDAPEPLLSLNAEAAFNPASVMKLVTSFAALATLGPDFVWHTDVWALGTIDAGVLDGDLVIKGYGDPTLTLERLWLLQRRLRALGIRDIRGRLVLDTSHFRLPDGDPSAFDGEPHAPYNALPGALVANYNALQLRLRPHAEGVDIEPEVALPGVTLAAEFLQTERDACPGGKAALTPYVFDGARPVVALAGVYPRACGEQVRTYSLFDATRTFDLVFRGLWAESGGALRGPTVRGVAPAGEPLLRFASPPLSEALVRLNKYSNNLMTRNLLLTLGASVSGAPATLEKGTDAVAAILQRHGIVPRALVLENGAGLSRIERIDAAALTALLRTAYQSPLFAEFASSMPILAVDGTLRKRFNGTALAGNAHLKTGSLRDVRALAGYVTAADGRRMSFVMLVNDPNAARSEAAQRALLEWTMAGGPRPGASPRP